ncbi:MAG: ATP-binding cassette domain-containing protein [Micromonosporaceae bacterium]
MGFVVEAAGLAQRYGSHWVLRDLQVEVPAGVTVLLGPNGAGKTTLLETIATLRRPAGGSLKVLGLDATRSAGIREIRRRVGFLPQHFGYLPSFTAREFVEYAAWLKLLPERQIAPAAARALEMVDLSVRADSKMKTLSGGMLRRVAIAQAIVHEPELVVMDEPAVGLDPSQRMQFRALVRRMAGEAAFLVSTHIVDDVRHVADEVQVLSDGELVFRGSPDELQAAADAAAAGDTELERGYSTVLAGGS